MRHPPLVPIDTLSKYKVTRADMRDILRTLSEAGGEIKHPGGLAVAALVEAMQRGAIHNMAQRLRHLEQGQWIVRDVRGKRTFAISLAASPEELYVEGITAHAKPSAEVEVVPRPRSGARRRAARQDLLLMVQMAFPGGIPTEDVADLEDDLSWIGKTGEILERR